MAGQKLTEADLDAARMRDRTEPSVTPHMFGLHQEPGFRRVFTGNAFEGHTPRRRRRARRQGFWRAMLSFLCQPWPWSARP